MWKRLNSTKKQTFYAWLPGWILILLLNLLQTITGLLEQMVVQAWLCLLLLFIPGFGLSIWSLFQNRKPLAIIPLTAHRAVVGLSLFYSLLALATFLGEAWATATTQSLLNYRYQSLLWLLPMEVLLLVIYYLLFFRRHDLYTPTKEALVQLAGKQASNWDKQQDEVRKICFELIGQGEIKEALEALKRHYESNEIGDINALVQLQAQYSENEHQRMINTISPEEGQRQLNKITAALMNLLG